jgi:hypothetical protein
MTIQTVEDGLHYGFKLSVIWISKAGLWNLEIRTVKTVQEHKEKWLRMPLWALFWLRQQMASMLVEHDGSEQTNEPPTMPEWAKGLFLFFWTRTLDFRGAAAINAICFASQKKYFSFCAKEFALLEEQNDPGRLGRLLLN